MWKIWNKKMWCNEKSVCFLSDFCTILSQNLKSYWVYWYFDRCQNILADLSFSYSMKSFQPIQHTHPQVFPNLYFLIPLLSSVSFIPGDTDCPGLDFTDWKPNMRTEREAMKEQESRILKGERPSSKLTTGCESVTLASTLAPFHFFPPFFCYSIHPPWRQKVNICLHSVAGMKRSTLYKCLYLQELTENCQKSPSPVKPRNIHSIFKTRT